MTSEEKAREIANNNSTHAHCSHGEHFFTSAGDCYKSGMQMAEWKDEQAVNAYKDELLQFKNILNRIRKNAGKIIDIEKSVEQFKMKLKGGE